MMKNFEQFNESKAENRRYIDIWNSYIDFINPLAKVISKYISNDGELTTKHLSKEDFDTMNDITLDRNITDVKSIKDNLRDIEENAQKLLFFVNKLVNNKDIKEEDYFKPGVINKLKSLINKDIIGLKN